MKNIAIIVRIILITESEDELSFTASPVKSSLKRRSTFLPQIAASAADIHDIECDEDDDDNSNNVSYDDNAGAADTAGRDVVEDSDATVDDLELSD